MNRFFRGLFLVALVAACRGESGLPVFPVEGLVTLDEEPLSDGSIILDPVDGVGPSTSGRIRSGVFRLESTAGEKRVEIRASRETGEVDDLMDAPIVEEMIPRPYNVDSKLTATIEPDGKNRLVFELSSSAQ